MSDREEWNEWQSHDGGGMPVPPWAIVETVDRAGHAYVSRADDEMNVDPLSGSSWEWRSGDLDDHEIIRYRIKRPRALLDMIERAASLPTHEPANRKMGMEDA